MTTKERILEIYQDKEDCLLFADGFDEAIIGIDDIDMRIIYSVDKCIEILTEHMSEEYATDFFYFNSKSAYVGRHTPIWCETISDN